MALVLLLAFACRWRGRLLIIKMFIRCGAHGLGTTATRRIAALTPNFGGNVASNSSSVLWWCVIFWTAKSLDGQEPTWIDTRVWAVCLEDLLYLSSDIDLSLWITYTNAFMPFSWALYALNLGVAAARSRKCECEISTEKDRQQAGRVGWELHCGGI